MRLSLTRDEALEACLQGRWDGACVMLEATRKLNDSTVEPEAEETPEGVASSAAGVDESSSNPPAASASAATESQGGGYLLSAGPTSWRRHLG